MPKKEYSAELIRMLACLKADKVGTLKDYKKLSEEEIAIYLEELDKFWDAYNNWRGDTGKTGREILQYDQL